MANGREKGISLKLRGVWISRQRCGACEHDACCGSWTHVDGTGRVTSTGQGSVRAKPSTAIRCGLGFGPFLVGVGVGLVRSRLLLLLLLYCCTTARPAHVSIIPIPVFDAINLPGRIHYPIHTTLSDVSFAHLATRQNLVVAPTHACCRSLVTSEHVCLTLSSVVSRLVSFLRHHQLAPPTSK